jgi:DNA-binding NtrC family response regulator
MSKPLILIIEDNPQDNELLVSLLKDQYEVISLYSATEALSLYDCFGMKARVVLLSLSLEDAKNQNIDILPELKKISSLPEIIVYSDNKDIQTAVMSIKKGAFDYFVKPFNPESVRLGVEKALSNALFLEKLETVSKKIIVDQVDLSHRIELVQQLFAQRRASGQAVTSQELMELFPAETRGAIPIHELKEKWLGNVEAEASVQKPDILVIEDDTDITESISELLSPTCNVTFAFTGQEALQKAQSQPFDVAFLDIYLPDMTGVQLLPLLKAAQKDLQVIVMTAYKEIDVAVKTLKEGACDYLNKPFFEVDLLATLSKTLQKKYFDSLLPQLDKRMSNDTLPFDTKIQLLENVCKERQRLDKKVYMEDVYSFFPEMRQTGIPEGLHVPPQTVQDGMRSFVEDLYERIKSFNPRADF